MSFKATLCIKFSLVLYCQFSVLISLGQPCFVSAVSTSPNYFERFVGIKGAALWFKSYIMNRSFSTYSSVAAPLTFGVLQGSTLGQFYFPHICCPWALFLGNISLSAALLMTFKFISPFIKKKQLFESVNGLSVWLIDISRE